MLKMDWCEAVGGEGTLSELIIEGVVGSVGHPTLKVVIREGVCRFVVNDNDDVMKALDMLSYCKRRLVRFMVDTNIRLTKGLVWELEEEGICKLDVDDVGLVSGFTKIEL